MMTKQAKASLAAGLSHSWFRYANARNAQEKQATAAEFMQKIANSNASMREKQALASALSRALPWAAKGLAGLGRGAAAAKGAIGKPLASMGRGASLMGKGLQQGVTSGGNLSRAAGSGGGLSGRLGSLMQRAGGGMQRAGNAGIASAKAAPSMAKSLKGMQPAVKSMQSALGNTGAGGLGRNINTGAAGAGLFGLGRASKGSQEHTFNPEQMPQLPFPFQIPGGGGGWQSRASHPGAQY